MAACLPGWWSLRAEDGSGQMPPPTGFAKNACILHYVVLFQNRQKSKNMTTFSPIQQQSAFPWGETGALFLCDVIPVDTQMPDNAEPLLAVYLRAALGGSK